MFKRLVVCFFNIIFPPAAVYLLTGCGEDLLFNCILFLLAVIPSHIHGFYVSLTYFNRKRKYRKGVYPGKPHRFIFSQKVNNGGASRREMEDMKRAKEDGKFSKRISNRLSNRVNEWDDGSEKYYEQSLSRQSSRRSGNTTRRSRRYGEEGANMQEEPSSRSSRRLY